MRINFLFYLFLIVAFSISCNCNIEDDTIKSSDLFEFLKERQIDYNSKVIILLPTVGCGGCYSAAEQLILDMNDELANNDKFIIILTDISDFKKFKLRTSLPDSFLLWKNVILDKSNTLKFTSFYPAMFITKQGCITERIYQKPDNDMFRKKWLHYTKKYKL